MFAFVLFLTFCNLGESEGQNCTFPCNWHNKDFKWMEGDTTIGFWNFSETTFILNPTGFTINYECFKMVGRFLIIRSVAASSWFTCFAIGTNNADSFTAFESSFSLEKEFTDECSVCTGTIGKYILSAEDNVGQNQTELECDVAVGCTPATGITNPIFCNDNGNIEDHCNEATTPPPPTTLPPKRCKHRHP